MESGATRTKAHTSMPEIPQADTHFRPVHPRPGPPAPGRFTAGPAPPPLSPADPAPRPTEPCRPRLTQARPLPRPGGGARSGLPAPWQPWPPCSASKGDFQPSRKQVLCHVPGRLGWIHKGTFLPWGPLELMPAEARGAGPAPHCGPRQREWTVQRPAGQCAPCTEPVVLQGTQGPCAGPGLGPCRAPESRGHSIQAGEQALQLTACSAGPV